MRKLRIIIGLLILAFSFSVKGEVLFELDCNNKDISKDNSATCGVRIIYETEGITDISFDYATNLNVDVQSVANFNLNKTNNHIIIHTDTPLYDEAMNSDIIMNITLTSNDNVKESAAFNINNIKINNSDTINVDDVSESFNITLPKVLDNDCSLSSISIDNKEISNFNKDVLEYNLITLNEVIFIDAVRNSEKSSVTGLGKVRIPIGETKLVELLVKAESGKEQKYKLNITNKQVAKEEVVVKTKVKDSDNSLKVLDLYSNANKINYSFDSKKDNYNINVKDVNKIDIQAITNSASAGFVENYGPREVNLKVGNNVILVKVQAENGNVKTYTLNINVSETVTPKKTEITTASKTNNEEIILADEENNVSSTQVNEAVTTTQTENKSEDTKKEEKKEETTTNNEESVVTTGEDPVKDNNVVEEPKEEKPLFQKITIKGYDIGFSKDKHSYSLKVEKNVDELEIEVTPENLEFEIVDNKRIHNGTKVIIKVFDTEGEHEYTINIEKDSLFINIFCYGIFGVGLAVLVYVVYEIIKKKKKCKKVLNTEEI